MLWREQCAAVIPCLNEERSISAVVSGVQRYVATVLVVDDASTDSTSQMARQSGATVLRQESTRGKGAALAAGLRRAAELGFAWALTLDGDGQHAPADIPAFFAAAERTRAALVIGNRMGHAEHMPFVRRVVNRWMSARLSSAAGVELPDSQSGFRLLDLRAWQQVRLQTNHFEVESELLLAFVRAGFRVEFVPIQVIYKRERSKINPVMDTVRWFAWWLRARDGRAKRLLTKTATPNSNQNTRRS